MAASPLAINPRRSNVRRSNRRRRYSSSCSPTSGRISSRGSPATEGSSGTKSRDSASHNSHIGGLPPAQPRSRRPVNVVGGSSRFPDVTERTPNRNLARWMVIQLISSRTASRVAVRRAIGEQPGNLGRKPQGASRVHPEMWSSRTIDAVHGTDDRPGNERFRSSMRARTLHRRPSAQ